MIGESRPRTRLQTRSETATGITSTAAPTNTPPAATLPSDTRREGDTQSRIDGSHTHLPSPPPLPMGFPGQAHQSFAYYPGYPPPFQDHPTNFSHVPPPNHGHNQYGHGHYPFFQDPNTQALLTQAVTRLAIIMSGGRPQQMDQIGGGAIQATNGFPGSPGWGAFPVWPPSTPTTSRYPYGHDPQQRSFQGPYFPYNQTGGEMGPSMASSTLSPQSNIFPASLPQKESLQTVQEIRAVQEGEGEASRARSRSKSKRRVSFALDPRSGAGPTDKANDPGEMSGQGAEGSSPTTRGSTSTKGVGRGRDRLRTNRKGKAKVDEADQGPELDISDSDEGGGVSVDRNSPPKTRSRTRGRTPGPGRR